MLRKNNILLLVQTFFALISLTQGLSLPPPPGPYNVGSKPYVLNRTNIHDPVAPNNISTSILLNVYYPTRESAPLQKYIWKRLAAAYEDYYSLPVGAFADMTANIAYNAPPLPAAERDELHLPTLFFGPAAAGPPSQMFLGIISGVVSQGYVVVSTDHPYGQPYLEYPNGTGIPGHSPDWSPEFDVQLIQDYRLEDTSAALDALPVISEELGIPTNLTHVAFFGHSLGGSAALNQVLYERNRTSHGYATREKHLLGAIDIDGTIFGPALSNSSSADLKVPSLLLASSIHERTGDHSYPIYESQQSLWVKELRILGKSNHTDYSDLIFLKQANGIEGGEEGAITGKRMLEIANTLIEAFMYMISGRNGGAEGVLRGDDAVKEKFPEVAFEYNGTGDPCAPDLCQPTAAG